MKTDRFPCVGPAFSQRADCCSSRRPVKKITRLAVVAFSVLALSGCTSIQLALGLRMRLTDVPVSAVTVTQFKGPGIAPGKSSRLVAVATTTEGKELVTEGAGRGKVLWDSFDIETSVVQMNRKGRVTLPADPRISEGLTPHLRMTVKGHPDVTAELDIPVRYDAHFTADYSGAPGADGAKGSDGNAGYDGAPGSTDPKDPKPGGSGGDGESGGNGENGQPGEAGEHVDVWVTRKETNGRSLLQVKVAGSSEQLFLVDPNGGSLVVKADGGAGGAGGAGGQGGRGGSGGAGNPSGCDGNSGWAGEGGAAGTIAVTVDPQAKPFLSALSFLNRNASGYAGPPPIITEARVPPLW
jgi:hypothetical protein